jgi:hypothetical protein
VVKTFRYPRLIPKHLTGSEMPNCESSVKILRCPALLNREFPDCAQFNNAIPCLVWGPCGAKSEISLDPSLFAPALKEVTC